MASPDILALDSEVSFLGHYASDNYARENFRDTSVPWQIHLMIY